MSYEFEWDPAKAAASLAKHGVSFEEAVTAFGDPFSINMPDPSHSAAEERFLVLGMSDRQRPAGRCVCRTRAAHPPHQRSDGYSTRASPRMKKTKANSKLDPDRDTMRPEYDFSKGVRGVTAARYAQGTNLVLIDPELHQLFPTSEAVNDALRSLASIAKRAGRAKSKKRPA